MSLKQYKPNTPGQRGLVLVARESLHKGKPFKKLTKGLTKNGLWRSQNQPKNFQKIRKNDEKFFSLIFVLLYSIECIVTPRLDTMTIKPFLSPLCNQNVRQITF